MKSYRKGYRVNMATKTDAKNSIIRLGRSYHRYAVITPAMLDEARRLAESSGFIFKRGEPAKLFKLGYNHERKMKRASNPSISSNSLPIGTWEPAHAIRQNADGTIDILREKNTGRRKNISQGYMAGGVFHPIRAAADYDPSRVGESKGKKRKAAKKKKPATKKRATPSKRTVKKKSTRSAMRTSRATYWSD